MGGFSSMKKIIVEVVFKDGQTSLEQTEFVGSVPYSEYLAFNGRDSSKIEEINFVRFVES
jgi:hypothetical protein